MANGMQFVIGTELTMPTKYQSDIYFDINGKEGNNCLYNAEKCKNPDRFKLIVSGDGHVMAADPMGQAYLENRMNWRKTDITPTGTLLSAVPDEWVVKPDVVETPVATEPEPTPEPDPEPEPTPPAPAPEPDPEPEPEPEPDLPTIKPIEPIEREPYCPRGYKIQLGPSGTPTACVAMMACNDGSLGNGVIAGIDTTGHGVGSNPQYQHTSANVYDTPCTVPLQYK